MKEELLKNLTEEQISKAKACKNTEEILKLAKEESIELNDEQLEAVSGGCGTTSVPIDDYCPKCHSDKILMHWYGGFDYYRCRECQHEWKKANKAG